MWQGQGYGTQNSLVRVKVEQIHCRSIIGIAAGAPALDLHYHWWNKQDRSNFVLIFRIILFKMSVMITMSICVIICMKCLDLHKATLDYVVYASITRFSVSIGVYCSNCLCVFGTKQILQCSHSNFVKSAYHFCLYVHTNIYSVR